MPWARGRHLQEPFFFRNVVQDALETYFVGQSFDIWFRTFAGSFETTLVCRHQRIPAICTLKSVKYSSEL